MDSEERVRRQEQLIETAAAGHAPALDKSMGQIRQLVESIGKRSAKAAVVELAVDYAVPDIRNFVVRVEERKGTEVLAILYQRA